MSARQDISRCLDQWLQLTQAEASAIQSGDWTGLCQIQTAKTVLQKNLDHARQQWSRENPGAAQPPFQPLVARLISLEARNADLLAARLNRARAERTALDQTHRTLGKIQRSYTLQPARAAWQCCA